MDHSSSMEKLQLFPAEIWDAIAPMLEGDELVSLFLLGSPALSARLRRSSTITLVWRSPAYCDWTRCNSLISAFVRLTTLSLKSHIPSHLSPSPLDCARLPPNLTSLSLHYGGSMNMLSSGEHFFVLQSLTSLSIRDEALVNLEGITYISFEKIPPSVAHLSLYSAIPDKYFYFTSSLGSAARNFKTLITNLTPNAAELDLKLSTSQPLVDLRLQCSISFTFALTLDHIPSTLQCLEIGRAQLYHGGGRLFSHSWNGVRYSYLFPQLHTLILPYVLEWDDFERLPVTLTRLQADFNFHPQSSASETCKRLNKAYFQDAHLPQRERPGAPAMIQHLVLPGPQVNLPIDFLPYFLALKTLKSTDSYWMAPFTALPKSIQSIQVGRISSPAALLPRSLTSITCDVLALKPLEQHPLVDATNLLGGALETPIKLSSLVKLSMKNSRISHELVSLLPATMEHLEGAIATQDVLEALTRKVNVHKEMPLLSTLTIKITHMDLTERPLPIMISKDTIPTTIKTLTLYGMNRFAPPKHASSLHHHPTLTSLNFLSEGLASSFLPQLPPKLRQLTMNLFDSVNLNDPADVHELLNLPPTLRELKITLVGMSHYGCWFTPVMPSLKVLPRSAFIAGADLYSTLLDRPLYTISRFESYLVSEYFISSCLPRTLSSLSMPIQVVTEAVAKDHQVQSKTNAASYESRIAALPQNLSVLGTRCPNIEKAYFDRIRSKDAT